MENLEFLRYNLTDVSLQTHLLVIFHLCLNESFHLHTNVHVWTKARDSLASNGNMATEAVLYEHTGPNLKGWSRTSATYPDPDAEQKRNRVRKQHRAKKHTGATGRPTVK